MNPAAPAADARLALRLFAHDPARFGAIALRGGGPVRDMLLEELRALLPAGAPLLRLPTHCDDEALLGGLDLAASLAAARTVRQAGIVARAAGGVLIVPMADRIEPALAGRLAQMVDDAAARCGLVLLDDGVSDDEAPPASLLERAAFLLDLREVTHLPTAPPIDRPAPLGAPAQIGQAALESLASVAAALGVVGLRPLLHAAAAARANAALHGRTVTDDDDLTAAARLVLAPRATRLPQSPEHEEQAPQDPAPDNAADSSGQATASRQDVVLEAAIAALPPDLLAQLAAGAAPRRTRGGGRGKRARAGLRGRPLAARPGLPRGGARLALIDTLRAAVPWQALRRSESAGTEHRLLELRRADLRIRRFAQRSQAVTIVCVDASGSAAMARLAEAKGAVERLLAQAYVTRSEVALISFRGEGADLLLPPTRSLTRARRALAELPGGGGTPLAAAITAARRLADGVAARGATPLLVFLTDGSANVAADGSVGRARAGEDALAAARQIAADGHGALVMDIAPRPRAEAQALAAAMHARHVPLPLADSSAIARAVTARREAA
jgi:magnesium chelatase subunit D